MTAAEAHASVLEDVKAHLTLTAKFVGDERADAAKEMLKRIESGQPITPAPTSHV